MQEQLELSLTREGYISPATAVGELTNRPLRFGDISQISSHKKLERAMVIAGDINSAWLLPEVEGFPDNTREALELLEFAGYDESERWLSEMTSEWRRFVMDRARCGARSAVPGVNLNAFYRK